MLLMQSFFIRKGILEKHLKTCSNIAGIAYSFNKGKIVTVQESFKYMGDLHFKVYFSFETTTGDSVTDNKNMYVIS